MSAYRDLCDPDLEAEAYQERRARRRGCLCGWPDWPGRCPGPEHCPVHGENLTEEESDDL